MTVFLNRQRYMNFSIFLSLVLQLLACNNEQSTTTTPTPQYQPADSAALTAVAKDTVAAVPAKLLKTPIDSNSRVIYFTFDDGPLSPTPYLTEIINEKQIKISEFAVGKHANANKAFRQHLEDMKRNPLIEVHNHSISHANSRYKEYYSAPASAAKDIMDNEEIIGTYSKIVRMPGRDIWATPKVQRGWHQSGAKTAAILLENGFKVYGWDMEWSHRGGVPKGTAEQLVAQVDRHFETQYMQMPNHLIILAHDEMMIKEKGRTDLRKIIDMLKERGYIFEFMSHYPL
jgi:peptidoglycan-N-acetylglucosamine deacetylase